MLISQLHNQLCSAISHLPFRHPLPKTFKGRPRAALFFDLFGGETRIGAVRGESPTLILNGQAGFESPDFGDKAARKRRRLARVEVEMGVADLDIGQPFGAAKYRTV